MSSISQCRARRARAGAVLWVMRSAVMAVRIWVCLLSSRARRCRFSTMRSFDSFVSALHLACFDGLLAALTAIKGYHGSFGGSFCLLTYIYLTHCRDHSACTMQDSVMTFFWVFQTGSIYVLLSKVIINKSLKKKGPAKPRPQLFWTENKYSIHIHCASCMTRHIVHAPFC